MANLPLCKKYPLQGQKVVKKTIATVLSILSAVALSILLFSGILLAALGVNQSLGMLFLLTGICSLAIYSYEKAYFARYFYDLQNNYLIIRKGVFTYGEATIPIERIQDVFVDQDVLDQMFGLYDLHVSTASGQSFVNAHIDGLDYEGANEIKKILLGKMKRKKQI